MPTQTVNDENFPSLLKRGIVFVDWWAPWCGPCRVFGPIFDRVADQNPEVVFAKVNAEEHPDLAVSFGIRAIPTLMIFRDGILVFAQAGPSLKRPCRHLRTGSRIWTWNRCGRSSPRTPRCKTEYMNLLALRRLLRAAMPSSVRCQKK